MTRAVDFFHLFITAELFREICEHTNSYEWLTTSEKSSNGDKDGAWKETNSEEIEKLIALILYCGLVKVSSFHRLLEYKIPLPWSLGKKHHVKGPIQSSD